MLLIEELDKLIDEAIEAGDNYVASILSTLVASILEGTEKELCDLTSEFSRQQIRKNDPNCDYD